MYNIISGLKTNEISELEKKVKKDFGNKSNKVIENVIYDSMSPFRIPNFIKTYEERKEYYTSKYGKDKYKK